MKLSDEIKFHLMYWCRTSAGDIILPNFYDGQYEMDIFKMTAAGYIWEYEIKTTRSDFKQDFKKGNKHIILTTGKRICNRFFFVVPSGMVKADEVPSYCGLIYYDRKRFSVVRNAPVLHNLLAVTKKPDFYKQLCQKLSYRESNLYLKTRRQARLLQRAEFLLQKLEA